LSASKLFAHKKHIFFDLDDTLWDFRSNSSEVLRGLFADYDLGALLNTDFETFIDTYVRINRELWVKYGKKEVDKNFMRNHRLNEAFRHFGYDNYPLNLEIMSLYLERTPYKGKLLKDSIEILSYLKQRYTMHLLTNGFTEIQNIKLDNCGLRPYFSAIVISEEHGHAKPDERIFRIAESLSGASANESLMIGDGLETDIEGALKAGWDAIHVTSGEPSPHTGHIISQLSELRKLL
jgi:putative hydrolase of the HAD superfamily